VCGVVGCSQLAAPGSGRCVEHKRQRWADYETRRPDREETLAFYRSPEWRRARALALELAGGRCSRCGSGVRLQVDHIRPVKDGGAPFDQGNLAALCVRCHSTKTARENREKGRW